ncbi:olfactory receptor 10AG1-like [Monodelphis domestica]|uniref:olfactory receptor 10AG1-like n=1 Tax=Monodelphis domestica TaxID=13616 RepID=UPI000443486A|nr:olfactory receptor 10AG1-like [Monodelphis domestica]
MEINTQKEAEMCFRNEKCVQKNKKKERKEMAEINNTNGVEFVFVGFSDFPNIQGFLFGIFLVIYISILMGNGFIIVISKVDLSLQTPMYFFLGHFSFLEICYTSVTLPRMLTDLWSQKKNISLLGCATQLCFFLILGVTECLLLASMAYDRYVAICKPLYYSLIMNYKSCVQLVVGSWISGIPLQIGQTYQVFSLSFCGSHRLNHVFCDIPPLLESACGDTSLTDSFVYVDIIFFALIPFLLILGSYFRILTTIQKLPSVTGRSKALSTCSSHLIVVCLFFGSGIIAHFQTKSSKTAGTGKIFSLFYTTVTPLFNPLIYSLRNKDVIVAIQKLLSKEGGLRTK